MQDRVGALLAFGNVAAAIAGPDMAPLPPILTACNIAMLMRICKQLRAGRGHV